MAADPKNERKRPTILFQDEFRIRLERLWKNTFSEMPQDWSAAFPVGAQVEALTPHMMIPAGAHGVVVAHEDGDSIMSTKGRPLSVEFDVSDYRIPTDESYVQVCRELGLDDKDIQRYYTRVRTHVSPRDVKRVGE